MVANMRENTLNCSKHGDEAWTRTILCVRNRLLDINSNFLISISLQYNVHSEPKCASHKKKHLSGFFPITLYYTEV